MPALVDVAAAEVSAEDAAVAATSPAHSRPQIPALTGLRFFAAFMILYGHAVGWLAQFKDANTDSIDFISVPGMSLFFVLSGFVIHYNYRDLFLQHEFVRAICEFSAARFARLYPLFLVFLVMAIAAETYVPMWILGFFFTLTQSWWYIVYQDRLIINWIFGLSWSISTEMFFYAAYPAVVFWVAAVVSGRRMLWIAALYSCAVLAVLIASCIYLSSFLHVAQVWIPNYIASDGKTFTDSFFRWFFYFSPYARLLEFLLGCMTAQAIIQMRAQPPSAAERYCGAWALGTALLALLFISLTTAGIIQIPVVTGYVQYLENTFLCGPPVAVILFCVARYKTRVARFLALPFLVLLGEMSYSIYLVHTFTLRLFEHPLRAVTPWQVLNASLCVVCGIALTLIVSYGSYHLIEMPGRLWLRRALGSAIGVFFASRGKPAAKWPVPARPITAKRIALSGTVAFALLVVALSGEAAMSERVIVRLHRLLYPHRSEVVVLSASYGVNCRSLAVVPSGSNWAAPGNVTKKIKNRCDLSAKCDLLVNVDELGDPASGCGKDFAVTYQCTGRPEVKSAYLPGEANGKSVVLDCLATAKAAIESNGAQQAPSQ
jgi:peptidoglycan/LPS O-acetylase OafA/YrhL